MTHFLDKLPYDFSDPAARDLWNLLADNYLSKPTVTNLLVQAAMRPADINWDQPMRWVWGEILEVARKQDNLKKLVNVIRASGDAGIAARLDELLAATPVVAAPHPDVVTPTIWKGFDDGGAERIILSESTFLDISFLRRGVELGAAVCRLLVTMSGQQYYGTGFRIGRDLLLTNHHVLYDHGNANAKATAVEAWFGYERTFAGLDLKPVIANGDPASIVGAEDHDWAVIKVQGGMPGDAPIISVTGGKPVGVDDRVYIIQHPNGSPKKIGMIHNVVRFVDDNVVQYLTDTEGGSSGSPVFNEQWELVALHHKWVEAKANGVPEFRNQGQRIERVVEGLTAAKMI